MTDIEQLTKLQLNDAYNRAQERGTPLTNGEFSVKKSVSEETYDSGMVRGTQEGKIDYTLALDGPMFKRLAIHLTKGAQLYAARNWMKARGMAEYLRFKASALRHFLQWFWDERDEDHAAAVIFNVNGAEYVRQFFNENEK